MAIVVLTRAGAREGQGFGLQDLPSCAVAGGAVPRSAPAGASLPPRAVPLDSSRIRLRWDAIPDAACYRIRRNGSVVDVTRGTSVTDVLLWPSTTYRYTIEALTRGGVVARRITGAATTLPLPSTGFRGVLPRSSLWYRPIGAAALSPRSADLSAYLAAHAINPNMTLRAWGVAVAEARPSDRAFSVRCLEPWPCTLAAAGRVRIPLTARPDPAGDGHLAIYDPVARREWDMWRAQTDGVSWSAAAGATISIAGDGIVPAGTAGGDAANFPLLGGLIRPEEILQGHIDHALVFGLPGIGAGPPVCPATHNVATTADPNALREGQRVQLDPAIDVDRLPIPGWEKAIARAMQEYGMYLRDGSGSLTVYAENPIARGYDAWAKVGFGGGGDSISLRGIPWDSFRVVDAPDGPRCDRAP